MEVLQDILRDSALGSFSASLKKLILSVFVAIVITLFSMLFYIVLNAEQITFNFGY